MSGRGRLDRISIVVCVACLLAVLASSSAEAKSEAAISTYGGWAIPTGWLDLDGGGTAGGAMTIRDGRWTIDVFDVSWRRLDMEDFEDDLRFIDVMMNVWWDFFSWKSISTFVGGGVGYAYGTLMTDDFDSSDGVAWNAGIGFDWRINDRFRFSQRYRAVGHQLRFQGDRGQVVTHELTLGVAITLSDPSR